MILNVSNTIVAIFIGFTGLWFATDGFRAITTEGARRLGVVENPQPVPQVLLETMEGDHRWMKHDTPFLVEFIYTTCPTICQASGGDFAELRDHLAIENVQIPMYSISFDPENDDLAAMRYYAELHTATGSPWTIARPTSDNLPDLLKAFKVTVIPDEWGGYQHNIAVLLINKEGKFSGVFDTRAFNEIERAVKVAL